MYITRIGGAMNIPGVVRIGSCYYDVEFTNDTLTVGDREVMGVI